MSEGSNPTWNIDPHELGEFFQTDPEAVKHGAFGNGLRYTLPEGTLELFGRAGVAKFRNRDGSLTGQVRSTVEPTLDADRSQLIFFQPDPRAAFVFRQDGSFESVSSPQAGKAPQNSRRGASGESVPTPQDDANAGDSAPGEGHSAEGNDGVVDVSRRLPRQDASPAKTEAEKRVRFTGFLGGDPQFSETANGTPLVRFPVGEHVDDHKTRWHRVLGYRDIHDGLKDLDLKKGQLVEVVGYEQAPRRYTQDGKQRTIVEVRAMGVVNRTPGGEAWSVWVKRKSSSSPAKATGRQRRS